jgi:hypothetical protein
MRQEQQMPEAMLLLEEQEQQMPEAMLLLEELKWV